jgi:hypothetical protein
MPPVKIIKSPAYEITGIRTFDFTPPRDDEQEIARKAFQKSAKLAECKKIATRTHHQKR